MDCIDIAGLKVNNITKRNFLETVTDRLRTGRKTFVITPYSEFLYRALRSQHTMELLNSADISIPDGIGILLAAKFLSLPATEGGYHKKLLRTMWQLLYSGAAILFRPAWIRTAIPEKIAGADVTWDLCSLAAQEHKSVYLLGGFGDTPKLAARKLAERYPALNIVGYSSKHPHDPSIITDINATRPDIILVAFGPIRQEEWIAKHLSDLPATLAIGVGGTLDYIAGKRVLPPAFIRRIGLEWLWRLITQPYRIKRIWQATAGLSRLLIKYKVQITLPYRRNAVVAIMNAQNQVFVGLRKPEKHDPQNDIHWQLPQGGIDRGENPIEGARREAREETGIVSLEYIKTSPSLNVYDWPIGFSRKFRGQSQNIVYFRFTGSEQEINFTDHGPSQEFTQWKWVDIHDLPAVLHTRRQSIGAIIQQDWPMYARATNTKETL